MANMKNNSFRKKRFAIFDTMMYALGGLIERYDSTEGELRSLCLEVYNPSLKDYVIGIDDAGTMFTMTYMGDGNKKLIMSVIKDFPLKTTASLLGQSVADYELKIHPSDWDMSEVIDE